ncbi:SDR family NAD(P)-dependent oxidoreductase [Pontivivens nitratireducens]|uniref:SDR family NAD(P)-dependent oxidoreductase n=1 Tax=Pontivivens nitratireducens TaxID=2758038 RepID=UPI0016395BD6|nr:SDR family NAD(P)-dependent oxidoreductase [Pontibrevibacter nitratireducens]
MTEGLPSNLADKVALVTGAASGMGRREAELLAAAGARVIVADILRDEGEAVAQGLRDQGLSARFHELDVSGEAGWADLAASIASEEGRVDVLVCNAGANGSAAPDVLSSDLMEKLIAINLRGTMLGVQAIRPLMGRGASIITTGSICARVGTPGVHMAYHATKGAVEAFTRAAAAEYGPEGIRVNCIHPGVMPPMRDRQGASHATRDRLIESIPLRRIGEWDDVARVVLFLATDAAAYVSGTAIPVDGGFLAT